jgi:alpha-L-fucosidase
MREKKRIAYLLLCLSAGVVAATEPAGGVKARPEAIEAWKDLRFGMFICWGPVSLAGREVGWSRGAPTPVEEYDSLYKRWNPDKFEARQWVQIVKDSGARYMVFLLKHHDGFCLWDTKQTDYSVMNGPFRRDVVKEIVAACREQDIGFFPYYSTCDWHHPDFPLTSPGGNVKRATSNHQGRSTMPSHINRREMLRSTSLAAVAVWTSRGSAATVREPPNEELL